MFTAISTSWHHAFGLALVLAGAAAGYGGDGRRPVTGSAVRGSRRAVGLASEGRGENCRPATAKPRVNPGRIRRATLAAHFPRLLAPVLALRAWGRQARRRRCALESRRENCHSRFTGFTGFTGFICCPLGA